MLIEVVSHCYAVKHPLFAGALQYQLSSLVAYSLQHDKGVKLVATICFCWEDQITHHVVSWFQENAPSIRVCKMGMSSQELGRRSIGRNLAAKTTAADIIWFADVDQVYENDIFHRLSAMPWPEENGRRASMVFPRDIMIHRSHQLGDQVLQHGLDSIGTTCLPDLTEFVPKRYFRAIGGVQIVDGNLARDIGYLDGHRFYQQPRVDGRVLGDFKDDRAYRGACVKHGPIVQIDLPGVYRMRHTGTSYKGG